MAFGFEWEQKDWWRSVQADMSPIEDSPALLSFGEAMRQLDTSKSTLYRLLAQGELKGVKVGKQWRFRRADLTAYLERSPAAAFLSTTNLAELAGQLSWLQEKGAPPPQDATAEAGLAALAEGLLGLALRSRATDLHLEPHVRFGWVRIRVDGSLRELHRIPPGLHEPLLARFKEMLGMNSAERRLPQDGRFEWPCDGKVFDVRGNVLASVEGESLVLRILHRETTVASLDTLLGAEADNLRPLLRGSGMILVAGPARSGKTTLLYACLAEASGEGKKSLAIDEPVDLRLPEVVQIQIGRPSELTPSVSLRVGLRQDPDVILFGGLRDSEAVDLALRAALAGTLVIASIFAEDAPSAVRRLADLGGDPFTVANVLRAVIATRLVRRLSADRRTPMNDSDLLERIRPRSEAGGYPIEKDATFYDPAPDSTGSLGFEGRRGLVSVLRCDSRLVRAILEADTDEEAQIFAVGAGMRTLFAEGMRQAEAGETSISEVLSAIET